MKKTIKLFIAGSCDIADRSAGICKTVGKSGDRGAFGNGGIEDAGDGGESAGRTGNSL